eukprot:m.186545 g.186545  ORF g.186545 m.186545 type:complete len:172 (-) comp16701_c0_seq5:1558-2073(-)
MRATRVLGAICAALTVRDLLCSVTPVAGHSMHPTLNPEGNRAVPTARDWVLISKLKPRFSDVARGDVVVMRSPTNPRERLIKRVVATDFDVIRSRERSSHYVTIRAGHMWVEGDNGARSVDSTSFGQVSQSLVEGEAVCIIWPPSRWGRIQSIASNPRLQHMHKPASATVS